MHRSRIVAGSKHGELILDFRMIRRCRKFCVNGHLAGNCLTLRRSEHDRIAESAIARSYLSITGWLSKPENFLRYHGFLKQLTKAAIERALQAELAAQLGHDKHEPVAYASSSIRNGTSRKKLRGGFGELPIVIPRGLHGSFEPPPVSE